MNIYAIYAAGIHVGTEYGDTPEEAINNYIEERPDMKSFIFSAFRIDIP